MYIYSDIYKQFNCIGSACRNTCCSGWKPSFDSDTVDYYNRLEGEFGEFIRRNMYWSEKHGLTLVKMSDRRECPFLNSEGLCRIYIECGEGHMSETCRLFPRTKFDLGGNFMRGFTVSCEEVLRMLYDKPDPLHLCVEGGTAIETTDDLKIYELAQFIGWGMEVLQDETVPFSVALATVVYIGVEVQRYFVGEKYELFEACILQAEEIQEQFVQVRENLTSEMGEAAWQLVFGITDTFSHVLREAEIFKWREFLWDADMFCRSDRERHDYLMQCWKERPYSPERQSFLRKLAAAFFQTHSMKLGAESGENIYLRDLFNYFILAIVLPQTWPVWLYDDKHEYLSRLSCIARHFQQSNVVEKFVWPVIEDLFHPDLCSYAVVFMVLLED